jgi:hypothetical protein
MQHNPKNYTKTVPAIAPASYTSTQTGTGVDCSNFRFLKAVAVVGAIAATATMDITLEESDVIGSGYSAISGAVFTQIAVGVTGTHRFVEVFMQQRKKFIRAVATYGGSSTAVLGVIFELSGPKDSALATNTYDAQVA